jgi:hypothetical protein
MPMRKGGGMDATPEKPEGGRRRKAAAEGLLPVFREAIKAARGPREGDRVKHAAKGQSWIWRKGPRMRLG